MIDEAVAGVDGRDFRMLWGGQTCSVFGTAISTLALPSVAILTLHATPLQIGILGAVEFLPFPLFGLAVGVLADRMRKRRMMIVADAVRAVALASIPLAAAAHALVFAQLLVVAAVMGIGGVFFDVCYQSYLPSLVDRGALTSANARLEFTRSAAQVGGSGVAGFLIAAAGAARAIGVDAATYIISIGTLLGIRRHEPAATPRGAHANFIVELREGLAVVLGSPILRALAASVGLGNLGASMVGAVLLLYAYRTLHLNAAVVGVTLGFANVGYLGALLAAPAVRRFGFGTTLVATTAAFAAAPFLLPLAMHGAPIAVLFLVELIATICIPIFNINQLSFRQGLVAAELQGRMNATMRTFVWGTIPLGSFLGGALASKVGIVPTILAGASVGSLAILPLLRREIFAVGRAG